jgi:predicted HD superfamily hydrolase involved in NAD metabolism
LDKGSCHMNSLESVGHYLPFLERMLTPQRLQHSLGVMHVMGELAGIYSLDRTGAVTTGLLHDAAKDLEPERQLALAEEAGIELCHPCERNPLYLHGPVGAYLISKELGITDPLILDAIATHTYYDNGADFNTPFFWCLRFADVLEPGRTWNWEGLHEFRNAAYAGLMERAALLHSGWLIGWLPEIGLPVHPNMIKCFQELSKS